MSVELAWFLKQPLFVGLAVTVTAAFKYFSNCSSLTISPLMYQEEEAEEGEDGEAIG